MEETRLLKEAAGGAFRGERVREGTIALLSTEPFLFSSVWRRLLDLRSLPPSVRVKTLESKGPFYYFLSFPLKLNPQRTKKRLLSIIHVFLSVSMLT